MAAQQKQKIRQLQKSEATLMEEGPARLKKLVETSQSILIIAHISPDPDAVSSVLLLGNTLQTAYPAKNIIMTLEEEPLNLGFLDGYQNLIFANAFKLISQNPPDLVVIVDGNNFDRISRSEGQKIREFIGANRIKTAIIDHHELIGKDETDAFINNFDPAAAQTVYELLFRDWALRKDPAAAETAMAGFYADTGGFVYLKAGKQGKMFDFAEELVQDGANIEIIRTKLSQYTKDDLKVLGELTQNIQSDGDYIYSFLTDDFVDRWLTRHKQAQLQVGTGLFLDMFVRNIDNRVWGFIIYKNTLNGPDMYSVSLRALGGSQDVAKIANRLGGGGHKPAAGAKFKANSVTEAIAKVKGAIDHTEL